LGGSPGQMEPFTPSPLRNVVINEILPHTENPAVPQFIELYNHSTNSMKVPITNTSQFFRLKY
jgi:hypothetical protein